MCRFFGFLTALASYCSRGGYGKIWREARSDLAEMEGFATWHLLVAWPTATAL